MTEKVHGYLVITICISMPLISLILNCLNPPDLSDYPKENRLFIIIMGLIFSSLAKSIVVYTSTMVSYLCVLKLSNCISPHTWG